MALHYAGIAQEPDLFWKVTAGTRTGFEYSFGRRFNKDGQNGTANRFSFIVYYDFNSPAMNLPPDQTAE